MTLDEIEAELDQIEDRLASIRGETVLLNARLVELTAMLANDKRHGTFGTIDPPEESDHWGVDITSRLD